MPFSEYSYTCSRKVNFHKNLFLDFRFLCLWAIFCAPVKICLLTSTKGISRTEILNLHCWKNCCKIPIPLRFQAYKSHLSKKYLWPDWSACHVISIILIDPPSTLLESTYHCWDWQKYVATFLTDVGFLSKLSHCHRYAGGWEQNSCSQLIFQFILPVVVEPHF